MFKEMDVALQLISYASQEGCDDEEYDAMHKGGQEIIKLREQLNRSIGITLRIENLLLGYVPNDIFLGYTSVPTSVHQELKALMKEVKYE